MATKDDIKSIRAEMATKDELKALESKMATKDDLKGMTQEIISGVNELIQPHIDYVDQAFGIIHTEIKGVRKDMKNYVHKDIYHDDQSELRRRVTRLEKVEVKRG